MNWKKISRKEKENLYIKKMTQLQLMGKNPINDDDGDFVTKWDDSELNQKLQETISQITFEVTVSIIGRLIKYVVIIFISVGIIGLLLFGIRNLF